MAIRIGELPDSTLIARRLGTCRFLTCASPAYLRKHGTPNHPSDLSGHVGLHYANASLTDAWQFIDHRGSPTVTIPGIRLRANNGDALAAAAIAGLGIVSLPTFIVAEALRDQRLQAILTNHRRRPIGIHALFPPGRLIPRRVQAFADFLVGRFGERPYWDKDLP